MSASSDALRSALARIIREKLGEKPDPAKVIELLFDNGSVTDTTMRQHVVGFEYFRMMRETSLSSHQIEEDIGERFGLSADGVRYIRNNYARGGSRRKRGPSRPAS